MEKQICIALDIPTRVTMEELVSLTEHLDSSFNVFMI